MEKQVVTQSEFSTKLAQELIKAAKTPPKEIMKVDMEGAQEDPIGWMMRNIMRAELARLHMLTSIYNGFSDVNSKRDTADLIVASSRVFSAAMVRDELLRSSGYSGNLHNEEDLNRFAFIVGLDPEVFKKNMLDPSASTSGVILP